STRPSRTQKATYSGGPPRNTTRSYQPGSAYPAYSMPSSLGNVVSWNSRGVSSSAYARAMRPGVSASGPEVTSTPSAVRNAAAASSAAAWSRAGRRRATRSGVTVMVAPPISPTGVGDNPYRVPTAAEFQQRTLVIL